MTVTLVAPMDAPKGRPGCPWWCKWHTDDVKAGPRIHISQDRVLGPLVDDDVVPDFTLSLSLVDGDVEPRVWLNGRPFTLAEARAVGMTLVDLADTGGIR